MMTETGRFFGKYRGRVTDNDDPLKLGRVRAKVTDVFGDDECGWALPCFPLAAGGMGCFMIPPVDSWVWIEFEYGNPEKPIWAGCFFPNDPLALPATLAQLLPLMGIDKDQLVLKTHEWLLTIESSKIVLASLAGPLARTRIEVTSNSIKLTDESVPSQPLAATIEMRGPSVRINGSALEVT